MTEPIVCAYTSNETPKDLMSFKLTIKRITNGVWTDFITTNSHLGGKSAKFVASSVATSYFAKDTGTLAPLAWVTSRFGPLPLEFTRSGALRIFTLSGFQRIGAMSLAAAYKFVYVTVIFEGGVVVGSIANQFLSQETKDAIGGSIIQSHIRRRMEGLVASSIWIWNNFWQTWGKVNKLLIITHKDSVIQHSGLTKKWNFNFLLTLFSGLMTIVGFLVFAYETQLIAMTSGVIDAKVGGILILSAIIIFSYSVIRMSIIIKCPNCKLRWYWYALSKDFKRNIMIGWMTHCPRCNYPDGAEK